MKSKNIEKVKIVAKQKCMQTKISQYIIEANGVFSITTQTHGLKPIHTIKCQQDEIIETDKKGHTKKTKLPKNKKATESKPKKVQDTKDSKPDNSI